MGFFDAIGKLGKAVVGTALLPVDMVRDINPLGDFVEGGESKVAKRAEKISENFSEALDEIDEDD